VRTIFNTFSSQASDYEREREEIPRKEKGVLVSLTTLQEAKPCCQIFTNHNVIKKKFADILQVG
jgi:hypothetical protein